MSQVERDKIKVIFMGTPVFALASLKALYESGYSVIGVFTNPDKPVGRKKEVSASPVKEYAIEKNIPVFQPKKLRNNPEIVDQLQQLKPHIIAVTAYGKILPKEIIDLPTYGCINVHGSLLPKYRGSAPMQWSIIKGEKETGITTMYMDEGMDTGDMLKKQTLAIHPQDNLGNIHDSLMEMGAKLLVQTLDEVVQGTAIRQKQGENFTLAPMITKEMEKIDFNQTAEMVNNYIRGLTPFPSVYAELGGKKYKIIKTAVHPLENKGKPGEVVELTKNTLVVECQKDAIEVLEIKPEGSKKMDIISFLNGNKLKIGDVFNHD